MTHAKKKEEMEAMVKKLILKIRKKNREKYTKREGEGQRAKDRDGNDEMYRSAPRAFKSLRKLLITLKFKFKS